VLILLSVLAALSLGAISPGPSFLFVTRTAVAVSRRHGIAAAFGMGVGASLVCALSMIGVRVLLSQAQWLYVGFKILGGIYLVYLAWRIWRGAAAPMDDTERAPASTKLSRTFFMALATQLSNPKTLVVISGIFAALIPNGAPLWVSLVIPPIDFLMEASWYVFVAVAMSSTRPRMVYMRSKKLIDRMAGAVLGILGARLIFEGASAH
jgi:threonine/homoserine/homoserine lactone efflux protein